MAKVTEKPKIDQREERKIYFAVKRKALEYEKNNYTELVLVRTPDKLKNKKYWWKIFGHSAVFYKYWVGERLKIKVRLLPDTDYEVKSEEGCVSIDDIDKVKRLLKAIKIYPREETEWVTIFKLGERISEQDYVLMLQEDEMRLEMTNRLIQPKEHMTDLNAKLRDVLKLVHECVRKMDGVSRDVFGVDMERKTIQMQIEVLRTARGTTDLAYCLENIYDVAEDLYGFVLVLLNLRMMEAKKIYKLAEAVVALEKQIKKEMKKMAMAQVEDEAKTKVKARSGRDENRKKKNK